MKKLFSSGLFFLTTISVLGQAGMLDTTFGIGGKVITVCPGFWSSAHSLVLQPDGKIVGGGHIYNNNNGYAFFVRYNSDGSLDTSFSHTGIDTIYTSANTVYTEHPCKILLRPDGKIVGPSTGMVRINTDGSLDSTFGINGRSTDYVENSIALAPDGKIVQTVQNSNDHFAVRRYTADGIIDSSFGTNGVMKRNFYGWYDNSTSMDLIVRSDNSIIAAGYCENGDYACTDFAIVMFDTLGSEVLNGVCSLWPTLSHFNSIVKYPDGSFVAGGYLNDLNSSGHYIYSSHGGALNIPNFNLIKAIALQPDGKIVVGATMTGYRFGIIRINEDVTFDTSFGSGGIVITEFDTSSHAYLYSLIVQPDGKIIAGGSSDGNVALARYTNCGAILNKVVPCGILCNGAVSVTPFGKPPYSYLWSTGDTTSIIDSLCGGSYSLTITDSTGCISDYSFSLLNPIPQMQSFPAQCFGSCDGHAILTFPGTFPYTYNWSNGDTDSVATHLCSGTYTVIVQDANQCIDSATVQIGQPTPIAATTTFIRNPTCAGCNDGYLVVDVSGGTPSYNVTWLPSIGSFSEDTIFNLPAGIYSITITDRNGCIFTYNDTLIDQPDQINNPETKNGFQIIPNPANSILEIISKQNAIESVEIYNLLGEKVMSVQVQNRSGNLKSHQTIMNISSLPPSVYFVKVQTGKGSTVQRLIVSGR